MNVNIIVCTVCATNSACKSHAYIHVICVRTYESTCTSTQREVRTTSRTRRTSPYWKERDGSRRQLYHYGDAVIVFNVYCLVAVAVAKQWLLEQ